MDEDNGTARKVDLLRKGDSYVPAIQIHASSCQFRPGSCCKWWYKRCEHLRTDKFEDGKKSARDLAKRMGCRCGC